MHGKMKYGNVNGVDSNLNQRKNTKTVALIPVLWHIMALIVTVKNANSITNNKGGFMNCRICQAVTQHKDNDGYICTMCEDIIHDVEYCPNCNGVISCDLSYKPFRWCKCPDNVMHGSFGECPFDDHFGNECYGLYGSY